MKTSPLNATLRVPCTLNPTPNAFWAGLLLLLTSWCVVVPASHAALTVTNLYNTHAVPGYEMVDDIGGIGHDLANSFTTGGSSVLLNSVSVEFAGGFVGIGSAFTAYLYNDATGMPGASLVTFTGNSDPHSGGTFAYTPSAPTTLLPSTTYWLVFNAQAGAPDEQYPIYTTADVSQTGDPGWSIGDSFVYRDVISGTPGSWIGQNVLAPPNALQFELDTTAVPEPSRTLLFGSGLASLLFVRRRRSFPATRL
ncbi:choice-of-anchor R domain-containing protein [Prosthecobacter sp.]|uniref:choice-of-anchor R domain-containing protein n=1 Tax=Prosthecobacter sp. TaxID=1965333 RepID=UPI002ABB810B|nr:choice-of-anchor R domain-containing protein [Prosthecobacter sp.]MDZ4402590.1 choice-of-anchor R domain-containing protein [Prosthecobacter sp.]